MRYLHSTRAKLTKPVLSARTSRVILGAMTQSVSLGRSGTRSALQALAHPSNNRFPSFPFDDILTASCRRLLVLGYLSGLQIWDCTNLDSITEMLNVSGPEWGTVWTAQVLPGPLPPIGDQFLSSRPLTWLNVRIYFLFCVWCSHKPLQCQTSASRTRISCIFPFNSQIIKKFSIPGILSFSANSKRYNHRKSSSPFVNVSPHNPRLRARQIQLHSVSFHLVHLHPYLLSHRVFQPSRINHRQRQPRTPIPLYYHRMIIDTDAVSVPHPIFALSHRFLAYTSRTPSVGSGRTTCSNSGSRGGQQYAARPRCHGAASWRVRA
jgi:hypothetical protein